MNTKTIRSIYISLAVLISIFLAVLGILAFSPNIPFRQNNSSNGSSSQLLRGIVTQVEQGKDGLQVHLQTESLLCSVTISAIQTEIDGSLDQIVVGAEIEVSGQEIAEVDPPLISAEYVRVIGSPHPLTGTTWELTTYNDQQPISEHHPTLKFEADQISGSTGCNHFGGSYRVNADSIKFEGIYSTEMACQDPEGIMDQERIYLEILGVAQNFSVADGMLTIFAENGQTLIYQPLPDSQTNQDLPTDNQTSVSQTNPAEETEPTIPPLSVEPPVGFKEYQDSQTGISIYIPGEWYIQHQNIVEGEYAIFSSYPQDKYIGGEPREPGDTKCDLNLNPSVSNIDELVQQWESSTITSIVSEKEIVLDSGNPGTKFVIDSMGRSTIMVTEINGGLVIFSCWGEFEQFDEIAGTLYGVAGSSP